MNTARALLAVLGLLVLSGCAYKPLKSPCAPDKGGVPLAYAEGTRSLTLPAVFRAADRCGPMRPI